MERERQHRSTRRRGNAVAVDRAEAAQQFIAGGRARQCSNPGSAGQQFAQQVLAEAVDLLRRIGSDGLLNAIADGTFGITRRPADAGRGLEGVFERAPGYFNPAAEFLEDPAAAGEGRQS